MVNLSLTYGETLLQGRRRKLGVASMPSWKSVIGAFACVVWAASAQAVTLTSGATTTNLLEPLTFNGTTPAFYSYGNPDNASANFPAGFNLQASSNAVLFLVNTTDSGLNSVSVGFVLDAANDTGGGNFDVALTGLDGNPSIGVLDGEANDGFFLSADGMTFTADLGWVDCCTDGFILDGIDALAMSAFTIAIDLDTLAGIDTVSFAVPDGMGGRIVPFLTDIDEQSGTLEIEVSFAPVPLPAPAALLLSGLGLIYLTRRRAL